MTLVSRLGLATGVAVALSLAGASAGLSQSAHGVDEKQACLTCHDLDGAFDAPVRHAPVEEADCSACHNPHASRLGALLRGRPSLLCSECHAETVAGMDRTFVHAPVADGDCSTCHRPHASQHQGLLTDELLALCVSCHQEVGSWQTREVQHSPFRQGRCERCHDPHASDFPALAADTPAATCNGCHPVSAKFRADHGGFPVEQADCQQCHDPHASMRAGLFRSNLHAAFEGGDCTDCHVEGGDEPFQLVADQAELCGDCHGEQVERSREAPFPHVSGGGGGCTSCHNPHAGEGEALLHGSSTGVCLSCHNPGGGRSGLEGHFVTHADLDCAQCHDPHGGDQPILLAADPIAMCNECHGHQHNVSHPMGSESLDPRNGRPLDCLSCHGIHVAPADSYLHADKQGQICIGCHKEVNY